MSANETSATIMASSLGVVVGDRGHGPYHPQAGGAASRAGWSCWVTRCAAGLACDLGRQGPDRQWRRGDDPVGWESQGRAPFSRDQRRGLEAILAVNGQTRAAGQGGQAAVG